MADLEQAGKKAEAKLKEWLNRPEEGFWFYRIPDQLTGFYGSANPCDFLLYRYPKMYCIESKCTYDDRFSFTMITDYQKEHLLEFSKVNGITSYIAVLFATQQELYLIDINDIKKVEESGKKSLNIKKKVQWNIPYIQVRTLPSRKAMLDYDFEHAKEIFK